eukprot:2298392-Rhodomonas_salina.2
MNASGRQLSTTFAVGVVRERFPAQGAENVFVRAADSVVSGQQQQAPNGDFLTLLFLTGKDVADPVALQEKMEVRSSPLASKSSLALHSAISLQADDGIGGGCGVAA